MKLKSFLRFFLVIFIYLPIFDNAANAISGGGITVITKSKQQRSDKRVFIWRDAIIERGERYDRIVILGGNVEFYADVNQLVVVGGNVVLHPGSHVQEELIILGGALRQEVGADVKGDQILFEAPKDLPVFLRWLAPHVGEALSFGLQLTYFLMRVFFFSLFGVIFYLFFPKFMRQSEELFRNRTGAAVLWIFISFILFFPGILVLILSILGIALIPLYFLFYFFLFVAGYVLLMHWAGAKVFSLLRFNTNQYFILLVGAIILAFISQISIGALLIFIVLMVASGAVLATVRDRLR